MITTLLVFAGSILVLVGIHEGGHFFMARAFGVYIHEFAIGFGPKLFSLRGKETVYSLRLVPFGGYVRMAGEDRLETDETIPSHRVLYNKPPYARALISLAGPACNLLLAFIITLIVLWATSFPILQVSELVPGAPAEQVLQFGDHILEMGGRRILALEQITDVVEDSGGQAVPVLVERGGARLELSIVPEYADDEGRYVLGAYFYYAAFTNEVSSLEQGSVLDANGLQTSDRILAVNDMPTDTLIAAQIAADAVLPASWLTLTIDRAGERMTIDVPADGLTTTDIFEGAGFAHLGIVARHAGFGEGLALAADQFVGYILALADVIRGVFTRQIAAGEVFQGPVGVAKLLGESIRISSSYFFALLAFLSLNFGLLNLVPFPALDGSRAVFALYEWVRGKPISPEREGIIHAIGFLILIGLMILITYRDIARLFQ